MIVNKLEEFGISFIDVGMGIYNTNNTLGGILRVTTSTPDHREYAKSEIPFGDGGENEYDLNIQIADLNSLNASLAVIKWKKLCGFYHDFDKEHSSEYTIHGNKLMNEDKS